MFVTVLGVVLVVQILEPGPAVAVVAAVADGIPELLLPVPLRIAAGGVGWLGACEGKRKERKFRAGKDDIREKIWFVLDLCSAYLMRVYKYWCNADIVVIH